MLLRDFVAQHHSTLCIRTATYLDGSHWFTKLLYYTGFATSTGFRYWEVAARWNDAETRMSSSFEVDKCDTVGTALVRVATDSEIRELLSHWDDSAHLAETLDLFISEVDRLHGRTVPDEVERLRRIVAEMKQ